MLFPAALFIRRTGQLPQNLKNSCDFSCFIHNYKYNNICANVIRKMRIPVYLEERAYMAYSSSGGAGPCDMEKIKEVLLTNKKKYHTPLLGIKIIILR